MTIITGVTEGIRFPTDTVTNFDKKTRQKNIFQLRYVAENLGALRRQWQIHCRIIKMMKDTNLKTEFKSGNATQRY